MFTTMGGKGSGDRVDIKVHVMASTAKAVG